MNISAFNDVIGNPEKYVEDILEHGFQNIGDKKKMFVNIQPRDEIDEFAKFVSKVCWNHSIKTNIVVNSDYSTELPDWDTSGGAAIAILYLSKEDDGKLANSIFSEGDLICNIYSKYNRAVFLGFLTKEIFQKFSKTNVSRLCQIILLEEKL
jgi:hypothetical protein